jgi:hypothetical protein
MTSYQDITREIGDQWVAALKRAEDAIAAATDGVREKISIPQIPVPDRVLKLNDAVTDRLPLPSEIVQANFELAERLLQAQRDLALRLLGSTADVAVEQEAPVAKKAPAKKAAASE